MVVLFPDIASEVTCIETSSSQLSQIRTQPAECLVIIGTLKSLKSKNATPKSVEGNLPKRQFIVNNQDFHFNIIPVTLHTDIVPFLVHIN